MKTTVFKEFKFSAAHHLTIPDHKCSTMHGHNYRVIIECAGGVNGDGMIVDFHRIKEVVAPIIEELDHKCLNDIIEGGSTSENIARWIAERVQNQLVNVCRVTLWETDTCGAIVEVGDFLVNNQDR
jgi:6-pyruvoyltetrahydropterin/6-carboxytetrahydropterin synthase